MAGSITGYIHSVHTTRLHSFNPYHKTTFIQSIPQDSFTGSFTQLCDIQKIVVMETLYLLTFSTKQSYTKDCGDGNTVFTYIQYKTIVYKRLW